MTFPGLDHAVVANELGAIHTHAGTDPSSRSQSARSGWSEKTL